jgi:hypothetical protein
LFCHTLRVLILKAVSRGDPACVKSGTWLGHAGAGSRKIESGVLGTQFADGAIEDGESGLSDVHGLGGTVDGQVAGIFGRPRLLTFVCCFNIGTLGNLRAGRIPALRGAGWGSGGLRGNEAVKILY